MKNSKTKNKVILFLAVLAGIIVIMIIANSKSSDLVMQIQDPPDGTRKLFTINNDLVCVSPANTVYIWNWNNLSAEPEKGRVNAIDVTWMAGEKLVWIPTSDPTKILVTDLTGQKIHNKISLNHGWHCEILRTSRNGNYTAVGLIDSNAAKDDTTSNNRIKLGLINKNFDDLISILTIESENEALQLNNIAVSEDGKFLALAGIKNKAWLALIDIEKKKILWEKVMDDTATMLEVTFSPDGNRIYAGGRSETIYAFDLKTAEAVHSWTIGTSKLETTQVAVNRSIIAIDISPDNKRIVATATDSRVYIWNTDTGRAVKDWNAGQRSTVGNVTFSTNKPYLATAGIAAKPKINIWDTISFSK